MLRLPWTVFVVGSVAKPMYTAALLFVGSMDVLCVHQIAPPNCSGRLAIVVYRMGSHGEHDDVSDDGDEHSVEHDDSDAGRSPSELRDNA